jgi:uncharacterized protein (DUF2342 family)
MQASYLSSRKYNRLLTGWYSLIMTRIAPQFVVESDAIIETRRRHRVGRSMQTQKFALEVGLKSDSDVSRDGYVTLRHSNLKSK